MKSESETEPLVNQLGQQLRERGWRLATAESCTGGWIAKLVTDIPGSSEWFETGVVTYSNRAKHQLLGVGLDLIDTHGAVSQAVVEAMVRGVLRISGADVALAVSGIAGPGGGTEHKPVGTVWIACGGMRQAVESECFLFQGNRAQVRIQAAQMALERVLRLAKN